MFKKISLLNGQDFGEVYSVSEKGEIFSHKRNIYLKGFPDGRRGYLKVKLYDIKGNPLTITIHRIVALYFVEGFSMVNCKVDHKNGDILNNESYNLEWVTNLENIRRAVDNNNSAFRHNQLSIEDVHKVCELLFVENKYPTEISKILKINKTTIDKISQRKNYSRISKQYIK